MDVEGLSPQSLSTPDRATWFVSSWKSSAVLALGIIFSISLLAAFVLLARPVALFFLAFCIAAALTPLVKLFATRLPRTPSVLLTYLLLVLAFVLLVLLVLPTFFTQFRELRDRLPELLEQGKQFLADNSITDEQINSIASQATSIIPNLIAAPTVFFSGLLEVVLVLIVSLYLLLDAPKVRDFLLSLVRNDKRDFVEALGKEIVQVAGGYVRGVGLGMILVGTVTSIGLALIGLPFALVLGILAGLLEVLPTIGTLIAAVPIIAIGFLQSPTTGVITAIFVLIVQQLQGNLISPMIMKSQAEVPRFLVPLAVVAGGAIGGILGALIAVPIVAVVRVLTLRVIAPFIREKSGVIAPEPSVS